MNGLQRRVGGANPIKDDKSRGMQMTIFLLPHQRLGHFHGFPNGCRGGPRRHFHGFGNGSRRAGGQVLGRLSIVVNVDGIRLIHHVHRPRLNFQELANLFFHASVLLFQLLRVGFDRVYLHLGSTKGHFLVLISRFLVRGTLSAVLELRQGVFEFFHCRISFRHGLFQIGNDQGTTRFDDAVLAKAPAKEILQALIVLVLMRNVAYENGKVSGQWFLEKAMTDANVPVEFFEDGIHDEAKKDVGRQGCRDQTRGFARHMGNGCLDDIISDVFRLGRVGSSHVSGQ